MADEVVAAEDDGAGRADDTSGRVFSPTSRCGSTTIGLSSSGLGELQYSHNIGRYSTFRLRLLFLQCCGRLCFFLFLALPLEGHPGISTKLGWLFLSEHCWNFDCVTAYKILKMLVVVKGVEVEDEMSVVAVLDDRTLSRTSFPFLFRI